MKRVRELDLARVTAMIFVIVIHVTSTYIHYDSGLTVLGMNLAFLLNQLARFAVPLFVMLSGVSLGLGGAYPGAKRFLRRRLVKIGLPYLFWSTVYLLYNCRLHLETLRPGDCLRTLLLGQAAPHLYFIVVMLQLYALYPLLRRWVGRAPCRSLLASFLITYTVQKLFYFLEWDVDLIPGVIRPYLWILFPTWLFYFTLGLLLTEARLADVRALASRNAAAILLATLVFAGLYAVESGITGSLDSMKVPLDLYVPLMFLSAFAAWHFIGRFRAVSALTGFLAKHSMTIYFEHVLVLYLLRRAAWFARGMSGMLVLLLAVTAAACLLAVPLDALQARLAGRWGSRAPEAS